MPTRSVATARWWLAGAALSAATWLTAQAAAALASEVYAQPIEIAQQLPTPTPFRFLTPTPFVPRTTTTTTTTTAPRAGGFPVEMAIPVLAGGLAAIGGGSVVLRRKTAR